MQISGVSTSSSISMGKMDSSPSRKAVTDQAAIKFSPNSFISLVEDAAQMPEVRGDVVDAFKSRIQAGEYPTQNALASLVNVIGGAVIQQARPDLSS